MKLRALLLIVATIIMISQSGCFEKHQWSEKERETIAMKALADYAKKENIPIERFKHSPSEINHFSKQAQVWVLYYESDSKPVHRLTIIIDQFGNAEVHREIINDEK